ncbi:hypothetical protein FKR81_24950 [Lentzea tibetensis]|uniref:Uncharacterized protein n=1 Tax=Lentzea tibetensis TaxID=2591470 RepID=A0A563EPQ5_9PSEU|nr:hypothetical protein [Lentzea tibetensis]TWP49354.1 hypothetical protein FKR81_24950 [Lentzea tibetensis]
MRSGLVATIVLACIAGVSFLTAWLITMGSKGGELADILSTSLGALSLLVTALSFSFNVRERRRPERHAKVHRPRWMWVSAALLTTALAGVAGYFWIFVKSDIPVTDRAQITDGARMKVGVEAAIHIPGDPPDRRYFAFVPALTNPTAVGDCVGSARLKIALTIDGRRTQQQTGVLPQQEITMDLDGVAREAKVLVVLDMQDPACEVDLSLTEAVLYN